MLLKLAKNGNHTSIKDNDWLMSDPDFSGLTNKQILFVAYMGDPDTPVPRSLPDVERRHFSAKKAGYVDAKQINELKSGGIASVEKALVRYIKLAEGAHPGFKMLNIMNESINRLQEAIKESYLELDDKIKQAKLLKELLDLFEKKQDIEKKLGKSLSEEAEPDVEENQETEDNQGNNILSVFHKKEETNERHKK